MCLDLSFRFVNIGFNLSAKVMSVGYRKTLKHREWKSFRIHFQNAFEQIQLPAKLLLWSNQSNTNQWRKDRLANGYGCLRNCADVYAFICKCMSSPYIEYVYKVVFRMMMMMTVCTINSSLVLPIEGLCSLNPYGFEFLVLRSHLLLFDFGRKICVACRYIHVYFVHIHAYDMSPEIWSIWILRALQVCHPDPWAHVWDYE